ncbi:CARDB domain-containing protein [Bradyrhizobium diazoefficiens]|uniref:CARDB domain-containing protein n=1 Tax=Bradyrhizobium diazoefficiens TaxID=1355477 RepID=UPI002714EB73|nr:CARDB domain-containing protein [Bradyrhizobium diazoefficiens]WLA54329.1 CARDB domain-containing protein [Bradyrhizobium diazoefficiens]
MATAVTVSRTNNADIDGMLSGVKWSGTITYSFPDSPSDYANPYTGGGSEPTTSGFASAPTQMQAAINYAIVLILGYTNANIQYAGTNGADIMVAQSPSANPTSYAYYPGNYASGGDVWFGTQYNYSLAALGNYYFTTALHELGHALGLKHSQETGGVANVAVPSAHDDSEYTVMSYRSYVGGPLTGYTNEAYGYPQTYMANDILALQTMYGANYTTQSGTTVYTWSTSTGQEFINGVGQPADNGGAGGSANRIFETIWDGGGVDTYDLSNYTTNLSINLNPGASSVFSSVQLAYLGSGHYASGNVYNAYLYNNDARSYIDNAIGGSGNDTIVGNAIANTLNGGSGNDTITGGGGNDTIIGGSGTDTAVYSGNKANYAISYNTVNQTFTVADQRSGLADGTDTVTGVEYFQFADGTVANSTLAGPPQPDLSEYVAVSQNSVPAGSNLTIDAYNMNLGDAVSGSSTAGIYLSTDATITTSDTLLAMVSTSMTLATVSQPSYYDHQTIMVALPSNLAPGTYYIGGIADYNNQVGERNETNNTYNVVQITVTAAGHPDLSEYVAVDKTTVAAGDSATVDAYNMNLGNAVAGPTTAGIYISTDATIATSDTLLTTLTTSSTLSTVSLPGYYDHQTVAVTMPGNLAPGTYYIGGISDYSNQLAESNETNNTYNVVQITVTAASQPDLSEYVAVDKTTVAAGDSVTVDAYTMNLGNAVDASPTTAGIYLSTDATITISDTLLTTISTSTTLATVSQPGYYDHQTVTVALPGNLAPGTYYIGGIADYNDHLAESNEANNSNNVVQVTVTAPPQPDLSEYVAVDKTTASAGTSLTVDAYNMNLGNALAGPTTAGIYLSTDATITTSDTLLTTISTSSTLATVSQPGYYDHQMVTVTLPGNLAPGTYYIGGIADYNNHFAESDETNNTYNVVQVTVPAAASSSAVQQNFALSQMNSGQSASGALSIDHAPLTEFVSVLAAETKELAAIPDATGAHFAFDNLSEVTQHHLGDYYLV